LETRDNYRKEMISMGEKTLHTIEPDDLFRLKLLQEARLAPDGKTLVYAVSHVEKDLESAGKNGKEEEIEDKEYVVLWLLSLETGESRQLTAGLACDSNPHWSPDGKQIAFLSTREEKPQIYIIPVDGGEARALTSMKQGVGGGPVWSPDGKYIAFTASPVTDPPELDKPYRVSRHIYRFDMMGYLDNAVQDIFVIPVEGGEPRRLTDDAWQNGMPQWSPDGQEILFSAAMAPDSHSAFLGRLRAVTLKGELREITDDWGAVLSAAWSPDGERIVFSGIPHGRPIGSKSDLWVVGKQGGQPECRTTGFKLEVGGGLESGMPALQGVQVPRILVTEDGRAAYIQVQDGGTVSIYRIALTGPESWVPVVMGERSSLPLDADEEHLLFAVSELDNPADLFIADMDGGDERQLTYLNADMLAEKDLPAAERLSFVSTDGVQVEGWILKPSTGEPPYPTILYIHGGPHSGFGHIFSFDFQMLAGAGYAVLFVNQRGSTGYGDEFATQIIGDWGNLDYEDLITGVDFAIKRGIADPERLGCCGLSGGGNLSCWIVGQTDRFKAAVPENPLTNWTSFYGVSDIGPWFAVEELGGPPHEIPDVYQRCSPITHAHRCKTPTLLVQGEADYRCPAEQSEQFYTVLKANGCIVEMLRLPASSHGGSIVGEPILRRVQNRALLDWMNKYVLDDDLANPPQS
jgi:dipeptidyl aminopeptidase/acylaminoacyl peptidase